jgi:uncharacterized protein (DUF2249 family)
MSLIPQNANQVEVNGATVPFYKYEENGVKFLQFDSSKSGHPEPMINAMSGLQAISDDEKLVMINSKAPMGLFPKIENDFSFEVVELDNGLFKIIFTKKGDGASTNFNDQGCSGGGDCSN